MTLGTGEILARDSFHFQQHRHLCFNSLPTHPISLWGYHLRQLNPIMRPVQLRVLHITKVATAFDQIAFVQLDPSPKPVHPEWPHWLYVIVDQIQTFRHRFARKAFHFQIGLETFTHRSFPSLGCHGIKGDTLRARGRNRAGAAGEGGLWKEVPDHSRVYGPVAAASRPGQSCARRHTGRMSATLSARAQDGRPQIATLFGARKSP